MKVRDHGIRSTAIVLLEQSYLFLGLGHDLMGMPDSVLDAAFLEDPTHGVATGIERLRRHVAVARYVPNQPSSMAARVIRSQPGVPAGDALIDDVRVDLFEDPQQRLGMHQEPKPRHPIATSHRHNSVSVGLKVGGSPGRQIVDLIAARAEPRYPASS